MSLEEIKALPIGELAAKDCALFMWITFPCMPVSYTHLIPQAEALPQQGAVQSSAQGEGQGKDEGSGR